MERKTVLSQHFKPILPVVYTPQKEKKKKGVGGGGGGGDSNSNWIEFIISKRVCLGLYIISDCLGL